MRRFAAVAVVAALAAIFAAGEAFADKKKSYRSKATNQQAWGVGLNRNPWAFPNCFVWSPRHRYWVWVCGPPYPNEMPHR